jgi:curli biogenesis system outer membrane secretion channel CsgG
MQRCAMWSMIFESDKMERCPTGRHINLIRAMTPVVPLITIALLLFGCATRYYEPKPTTSPLIKPARLIKPVIAVTDFENKSGFSGSWNLGTGMADILITELLDTDKAVVLERQHIGDVISEINLQGSELFRKEGKVTMGRLKTARFLIRGSVTDFTVTHDASGWFGIPSSGSFFLRGQSAKVTLHAMLIDVENGEVIGSVKNSGSASSGMFGGTFDYKKVNFGGEMFFRTPLGRATEEAMRKSVHDILRVIPPEYWRPVIAEANTKRVIINGGENVGIKPGALFRVMEQERVVTDPLTGDVIERRNGIIKGWIRITDVLQTSSHGEITDGSADRGDWLEPMVVQ